MDPKEQWQACQTGACVIPQKKRSLIEISGPDRGPFVQGLFSQDVVGDFPVGSVAYGIFPNVKGRIIADAYAAHLEDVRFLLDVESFALERLLKHLDTYLVLMKAEVKELQGYSRFSLLGAGAGKALNQTPPSANKCSAFSVQTLDKKSGFISSIQRPNFREFQVWIAVHQEMSFVNALKKAGAIVSNEGIYGILQIESGVPKLGREMDETTFPQEVGLDQALDFKKGCFVGAEVLQRIFYQGHVNRALALLSTPSLLPRRASIFLKGAEVGKITTCIESFQWDGLVALALIRIDALESREPLSSLLDGQKIPLELLKTFQTPESRND